MIEKLAEVSGVDRVTLMRNVITLASVADVELPTIQTVDPKPYCVHPAYNRVLTKGMMERKKCAEKNCPYFTYLKSIARWQK